MTATLVSCVAFRWRCIFSCAPGSPFAPIEGFDTKDACHQAALRYSDRLPAGQRSDGITVGKNLPEGSGYMVFDAAGKVTLKIEYRCLPDTIDPRH